MSVRIATNIAALAAVHQLDLGQQAAAAAATQLGTGLRIAGSADDAAGLTIAHHLTAQINGIVQAAANALDGRAVAVIADGALGTVTDALQRMRQLVLAAANAGAATPQAVRSYSGEIGALAALLDAIAEFTRSGGKTLLDGSYSALFQAGPDGGDTIALDLTRADVHASAFGGAIDLTQLTILGSDATDSGIYTVDGARGDLAMLTDSIVAATGQRSLIGAVVNQLDHTVANLQTALGNMVGARSNLLDADMAEQASRFAKAQIRTVAAAAVLAQANSTPQAVLSLLDDARAGSQASDRRSSGGGSGAVASPAGDRPAAGIVTRDGSGDGRGEEPAGGAEAPAGVPAGDATASAPPAA